MACFAGHFGFSKISPTIFCSPALAVPASGGLSTTTSPQYRSMPIAFKEWAVTVRALAEGEQLLTLRKGSLHDPDLDFQLEHDRFFLYPTFDHQRAELVRESHRPELARALEEGVWSDGGRSPGAMLR